MAAPSRTVTGRCNCGAVTFSAEGPFRDARACHCYSCRRQSGHYLAATQVGSDRLHVEGGHMLNWYSATDRARRGFCRVCGVHLFWEAIGSDKVSIFMGCLDHSAGIQLIDHIFVDEKGDYYEIADGLPQQPKN